MGISHPGYRVHFIVHAWGSWLCSRGHAAAASQWHRRIHIAYRYLQCLYHRNHNPEDVLPFRARWQLAMLVVLLRSVGSRSPCTLCSVPWMVLQSACFLLVLSSQFVRVGYLALSAPHGALSCAFPWGKRTHSNSTQVGNSTQGTRSKQEVQKAAQGFPTERAARCPASFQLPSCF